MISHYILTISTCVSKNLNSMFMEKSANASTRHNNIISTTPCFSKITWTLFIQGLASKIQMGQGQEGSKLCIQMIIKASTTGKSIPQQYIWSNPVPFASFVYLWLVLCSRPSSKVHCSFHKDNWGYNPGSHLLYFRDFNRKISKRTNKYSKCPQ